MKNEQRLQCLWDNIKYPNTVTAGFSKRGEKEQTGQKKYLKRLRLGRGCTPWHIIVNLLKPKRKNTY